MTSTTDDMYGAVGGWRVMRSLLGTMRIRVTSVSTAGPVFTGIAPADLAGRYLAGVGYDNVRGITHYHPVYTRHLGAAPAAVPAQADIWTARAAGPGTQTLTWPDRSGDWTVVAMNADGSRPAAVRVNVVAALPSLAWIATGLLAAGILFLVAAAFLIAVPVRAARGHMARRP